MTLMAKTILIVDDDPHMVSFLKAVLADAGYLILVAHDGLEGLKMARDHSPHLIFMDFLMPEMSGKEVTEHLRDDEVLKVIPIIAMTAFPFKEEGEAFHDWGFDDYVNKPISPEYLLSIAAKYLG